MPTIEEQLEFHRKKINQLVDQQRKVRARKTFLCVCGHTHRIKDCTAIQTHWYTRPHGCTGGDYWNTGELHILCPSNPELRQRAYFQINSNARWNHREMLEYNAEKQFINMYHGRFKETIEEYEERTSGVINSYFDENHKKFDIKIKKD